MAARRLSGRTAPPMEGFGNRVWILGGNTEKCECWTVGCATTLLPIAQGRDVDADHEREFTLQGTEFLPNGLDVGRLEGIDPGRTEHPATNTAGLPHTSDQFLECFGLHLNSSRMSAANTFACFGVKSPWSFFAYAYNM